MVIALKYLKNVPNEVVILLDDKNLFPGGPQG